MNDYPFDWQLFLLMMSLALPGFSFGTTGFLRTYWHYFKTHYPAFKKLKILSGFLLLNLMLVMGSAVTGILVSASTNARYVYFMALINQKNAVPAFLFEFLGALIIAFPATLIFLAFYYYAFRPALDEKSLFTLEKMRNHTGLSARIFYNSIIAELVFRWGLQSLFIFILIHFLDFGTPAVLISIVLTSLVYAFVHLLNLGFIRIQKHSGIVYRVMVLYFFSSMVYGIIFWKFGIFASMIAHAILHIIWYPLDIFYYRKFPSD